MNYIHLFIFIQSKKIVFLEERNPKANKINGIIHFINCGKADSILIEQNGRYGLIDACKPYLGATDIVESPSKDAEENPDKSVQAVINYLIHLGITHLNFVLVTHAHIDHIGGIPQIAYHFVDKKTKFLYKKYRVNMEDNEVNFKPAYNSMQAKGTHFITLKNEKYEFDFGDIHLELININYHKKEKKASENHNSIGVILSYKNKRIFLAGDFELENELIYKDQIGKIDMLKLSHHGSSFEFLNTTRPNYTIITNYEIPNDLIIPISILQQIFGGKVYYVGGVSTTTKDVATSAIRLYLSEDVLDNSEETKYFLYLENTGDNIDTGKDLNGFKMYQSYTFYFEKGKILTGLHILEGVNGKCIYYFEPDGHMVKDVCLKYEKKSYFFDHNGCCNDIYINYYNECTKN